MAARDSSPLGRKQGSSSVFFDEVEEGAGGTVKPLDVDTLFTRAQKMSLEDSLTEYDILVRTWCYPNGKSIPAVVIAMNHYVSADKTYIPCEIAMSAFSIEEGVTDGYCTLVDPKSIPQGFGVDGAKNAEFFGMPKPPFDEYFQNLVRIVNEIEEFILKHSHVDNEVITQPFLFCYGRDIHGVQNGLEWLYSKLGKTTIPFTFYRLEHLLVTLSLGGMEKIAGPGRGAKSAKKLQQVMTTFSNIVEETSSASSSSSSSGVWRKRKLEESVKSYFSSSGISKDSYSCLGSQKHPRCSMDKLSTHPYAALGGFIYEFQADRYLSEIEFVHIEKLACRWHQGIDVVRDQVVRPEDRFIYCALTKVRNQLYLALDALIVNYGVKARRWYHYPPHESERKKKTNAKEGKEAGANAKEKGEKIG